MCKRTVEAKLVTFTRVYWLSSGNIPKYKGTKKDVIELLQEEGKVTHEKLCQSIRHVKTQVLSNAVKHLIRQGIVIELEVPLLAKLVQPCDCGRKEVEFQENEEIWKIRGPVKPAYWYPKNYLRYKNGKSFLKKRDVSRIDEFFVDRSLALLAVVWHDINSTKTSKHVKKCLRLAFMATLARSSKMCRDSGGTWPINSYWIPRKFVVKNPYIVFKTAANQMINFMKDKKSFVCSDLDGVRNKGGDISFLIEDSTNIALPKHFVDYSIIDPPHTDEAQFFELSLFYTSWLRKRLHFENELIMNPKQAKTLDNYIKMLGEASERIHHALKRRKYFTTILHEEDQNILEKCVKTICGVGFKLVENKREGDYNIYTFQKRTLFQLLFRI